MFPETAALMGKVFHPLVTGSKIGNISAFKTVREKRMCREKKPVQVLPYPI
jgi:hypothetical protein